MVFDIEKFRNVKTKPRIKEIEIESLKFFFKENEKPIFKVRNLTGHEVADCNESVQKNKAITKLIEGLMSENASKKAQAVCDSMGLNEKTPDDLVRRISMLKFGTVDPEFNNEDSVRLAAMFPTQFYMLTNEITQLTGLGSEVGK